jgi:hypothetical protein
LALILGALSAAPARAYGPVAHQAVMLKAIESLPNPLRTFYKNHRLELPTLEPDAELPADEGLERRFAVDRLLPFPFVGLPRTERDLKARFGEDADKAGRLPWLIQAGYDRLVEAYKSGDKQRILTDSDALASLVIDIRNPLALTDNADGQKTEQHGLWQRYSRACPRPWSAD